jgi:hypothetical protein
MKNQDKNSEKTNTSENQKSDKNENLPYNPEITDHDMDILSQENIHGDGGDDQQLRDRKEKVDFAGEDLDIPGRKKARKSDKMGMTDEENKHFSQGGDGNENLERDESAL